MAADYTTFQIEDFVLDDSFQAFVAGSDSAAVQFWQHWLAEHPAQQLIAEQARQLVLALGQARQPAVAADQKEQDVQRLRQAIHPLIVAPQLRVQRLRRIRAVASVLVALLVLGIGYLFWPLPPLNATHYATQAGQQRTIRLPDGSVVRLNANSSLTTSPRWDAQSPREVWLEGEAYFQVNHLSTTHLPITQATGNAKFIVHAGDLTIAVLGTKFNVINRPDILDKVTLNEGQVQVEHTGLFERDQVLMKPGELVEYLPAQRDLVKREVKPAYYSAWVEGTLEFNRTPLHEIIKLLHDTYGLQVSVDDPALLDQTITGSVDNTNADTLLKALANSFGVSSKRKGQQVQFQSLK